MIYNANKILYQILQPQFEVSKLPNKVYKMSFHRHFQNT